MGESVVEKKGAGRWWLVPLIVLVLGASVAAVIFYLRWSNSYSRAYNDLSMQVEAETYPRPEAGEGHYPLGPLEDGASHTYYSRALTRVANDALLMATPQAGEVDYLMGLSDVLHAQQPVSAFNPNATERGIKIVPKRRPPRERPIASACKSLISPHPLLLFMGDAFTPDTCAALKEHRARGTLSDLERGAHQRDAISPYAVWNPKRIRTRDVDTATVEVTIALILLDGFALLTRGDQGAWVERVHTALEVMRDLENGTSLVDIYLMQPGWKLLVEHIASLLLWEGLTPETLDALDTVLVRATHRSYDAGGALRALFVSRPPDHLDKRGLHLPPLFESNAAPSPVIGRSYGVSPRGAAARFRDSKEISMLSVYIREDLPQLVGAETFVDRRRYYREVIVPFNQGIRGKKLSPFPREPKPELLFLEEMRVLVDAQLLMLRWVLADRAAFEATGKRSTSLAKIGEGVKGLDALDPLTGKPFQFVVMDGVRGVRTEYMSGNLGERGFFFLPFFAKPLTVQIPPTLLPID